MESPVELYQWISTVIDEQGVKEAFKVLRLYPERRQAIYRLTTRRNKTNRMMTRVERLKQIADSVS